MRRTLVTATLMSLAAAAPAPAATVRVETAPSARYPGYGFYSDSETVRYVAGPGERNRLLVSYDGDAVGVTVTDPGAIVQAGEGCRSLDEHRAYCVVRPGSDQSFLQHAEADLGDLDDEVRTFRPPGPVIGGVAARGGPGDDLLDGGPADDELDGGGGTDRVLGGAGDDVVTDGDRSGASGSLGPSPDLLDGGPGNDLVAYAQRQAGVTVDLSDPGPDGEPGERDTLLAVEDVMGGTAADRLSGDDRGNWIRGGAGDDVLVGRDGEPTPRRSDGDRLEGEGGRDRLSGGAGPDLLGGGPGTDRLSCGLGHDMVSEPEAGELLEPLCDEIRFDERFGADAYGSVALDPFPPVRSPRRLVFGLRCPQFEVDDGEFRPCSGTVTAREAGGTRRLLGLARVSIRRETPAGSAVRMALTPLGRRRVREPKGVATTLTWRGPGIPSLAWTVRLRVPRPR